jgi:hypothetical protein
VRNIAAPDLNHSGSAHVRRAARPRALAPVETVPSQIRQLAKAELRPGEPIGPLL